MKFSIACTALAAVAFGSVPYNAYGGYGGYGDYGGYGGYGDYGSIY